jgi:hypothetical protein
MSRLPVAERGERVGEQRLVQLDVPEVHRQSGAQRADLVEQRGHGPQGARVTAAVGDDDERGKAGAAPAVGADEGELAGELAADPVHEVRRTVEGGRRGLVVQGVRRRHGPIVAGRGCCAVSRG